MPTPAEQLAANAAAVAQATPAAAVVGQPVVAPVVGAVAGIAGLTHSGVTNDQLVALLAANGIELGYCPTIIDIVATRKDPANKSTIYVAGLVKFEGGQTDGSMSALEREALGFSANIQRGMITFNNATVAALGLAKGQPLLMSGKETRLRAIEKFEPHFAGQAPIGFTNAAGAFENKLKTDVDGVQKPFYRDTQLVFVDEFTGHSLL